MRIRQPSVVRCAALVLASVAGAARPAAAQMPGLPVIQNAFTARGFAVAGNYGYASNATGYGLALGWGPGSGMFQVSAGVGAFSPDSGRARTSFGGRVAVPVLRAGQSGRLAIAAFAGAGVASRDSISHLLVPVGASIGFRSALGATRGFSVYAAPFYSITRRKREGQGVAKSSLFRGSLGVDVTLTPSLGVTAGVEAGATAKTGKPGPTGAQFGVGVSFAPGRGT